MERNLQGEILNQLYKTWFNGEEPKPLDLKADLNGQTFTSNELYEALERLFEEGSIDRRSTDHSTIQINGIHRAENEGFAPSEMVELIQEQRTKIMVTLAEAYTQDPRRAARHYSHLKELGIDQYRIIDHFQFLERARMVKPGPNGFETITRDGLDAVRAYHKRKGYITEFQQISTLKPQARGRALQKLIAKIVGQAGWKQEEGVSTSNEEMDVIVYREREYYLLESKWEKDPVGAPVVRELFGKLGNRADVRGIVASMSGFTSGVEEQVKEFLGQKVILLFGHISIQAMINSEKTFESILNEKYHALVTKRQVLGE